MRDSGAISGFHAPGAWMSAAVALLFVALAHVVRVLFPRVLVLGEDHGYLIVALLALGVFAAPLILLPVARRIGSGPAMLAGGFAIGLARAALQVLHPIPAWLSFAAPATALAGTALLLVGLRARTSIDRWLAPILVLGLAIDTSLRALWHTWDLTWHDGSAALLWTAALLATSLAALAIGVRQRGQDPAVGGGVLFAIGPYLMLQLLFVQNPGYVGSQSGVGFPGAVAAILVADVTAVMAATVVIDRPPRTTAAIVGAGLAATLGWLTVSAHGIGAIALVAALQAVATACLASGLAPVGGRPTARRTLLETTTAGLSFGILVLAWMIDIDRPLPFPRQTVPAVAGGLIGLAAVLRARSARPARAVTPRRAPAIGAAILALAVLVPTVLWATHPTPEPGPIPGPELRIVSYNIRGGIGVDAMHRPDEVLREIASSDPDVVVLQEVARGWPVMGTGDVLAYLQAGLDMPYRYQPAADEQFGNAILSRLPLRSAEAGLLPAVSGKQRRSYLAVVVEVGDVPLTVVGTHLEADSPEQIEAVLDVWGGASPAVIAGDMNLQLDDEAAVDLFRDAGLVDASGATGDPCRTTSAQPTSPCDRTDWVWLTPDLEIRSFRIGAIDASDHLPIHVTVAVPR